MQFTYNQKVKRQCAVTSAKHGSLNIQFFEGSDDNRRRLGCMALEHAYAENNTLMVYRWFLHRGATDTSPQKPLWQLSLPNLKVAVSFEDAWCIHFHSDKRNNIAFIPRMQQYRSGQVLDRWERITNAHGEFQIRWSYETGPIVCRVSHVSNDLLLPKGEYNIPERVEVMMVLLNQLRDMMNKGSETVRIARPNENAVRDAMRGLMEDKRPSTVLALSLNVPQFAPRHHFMTKTYTQCLTAETRKRTNEYLEALAYKHRFGDGAAVVG